MFVSSQPTKKIPGITFQKAMIVRVAKNRAQSPAFTSDQRSFS